MKVTTTAGKGTGASLTAVLALWVLATLAGLAAVATGLWWFLPGATGGAFDPSWGQSLQIALVVWLGGLLLPGKAGLK